MTVQLSRWHDAECGVWWGGRGGALGKQTGVTTELG